MDTNLKKKVLRLFSNGMYVVTSRSNGQFGAATVTWISQSSFRPPLVMAAIRKDSTVFHCLSESRAVAIHVLGDWQQEVAQRFFAHTCESGGTINGEPYVGGKTSAPVLTNLPAYVECVVRHIVDEPGDHAVVVLEVVEAGCHSDVKPLRIEESPWRYGG